MKHNTLMSICLSMILAACAPTPTPARTGVPETYSDPFAYCAAVGTMDSPDARYVGDKMPPVIVKGLRKALNAPAEAPDEFFIRGSFWRCMNRQVYACTVGANLPCEAKANLDKTPAQAIADFCQQNPSAQVIPMAVTGRETVYEWQCQNGAPIITRQFAQPDARGFLANIWYEITPN